MNIYALLSLLVTPIVFSIGVFVFSKNHRLTINRIFLFFSIFVCFFAFTDFEYLSAVTRTDALYWLNLQHVWPILFFVQIHVMVIFIRYENKYFWLWMGFGYALSLVLSVNSYFNLETDVIIENGIWQRVLSTHKTINYYILSAYIVGVTLVLFFIGVRFIRKSKLQRKKLQALFLLLGFLIPSFYTIVKESVLQKFDMRLNMPTSSFTFLGWIFVFYAIWRYRLFDVTTEYAAENIISTMKEGLLLLNSEGFVIEVNKGFSNITGLAHNSMLGKPFSKFFDFCEFIKFRIDEKFLVEEVTNIQFIFHHETKGSLYLSFTNSFIRERTEEFIGCVCILSDVTELVKSQEQLEVQHKMMLDIAHQSGMAEIATDVMHNIGNVLNSVGISSEKILETVRHSKTSNFSKATGLLHNKEVNIGDYLTRDPKGKLLPEYFIKLSEQLKEENALLQREGSALIEKINLIKSAIEMQQDMAISRNLNESVIIVRLLDECLNILEDLALRYNIIVKRDYRISDTYVLYVTKSKILNLLLSLIKNAFEAVKESNKEIKSITLIALETETGLTITIKDNGVGISAENLKQIFQYGFTTKKNGHGFGLHYCANVIAEMKGRIKAISDGPGKGSEFIIKLPVTVE